MIAEFTYFWFSHVMSVSDQRLDDAFARFDAANAQDPRTVPGPDAAPIPAELLYARRMTDWLNRLYPQAPEPLQLAARAQHIQRWKIPRDSYPMDRAGYYRWRTTLYKFHADTAAAILRDVGYDPPTIDRVSFLLQKQKLKADPDTQALEDTICLVFLESYFSDFAGTQDEQKMMTILRRTWAKMSPVGHAAALQLPLPAHAAALVKRALGSD
jgi:hypothetical protein